jgi:hypothetical protein
LVLRQQASLVPFFQTPPKGLTQLAPGVDWAIALEIAIVLTTNANAAF